MKENSAEQHLVIIKPQQFQNNNSMVNNNNTSVFKNPKTAQNGKGPPPSQTPSQESPQNKVMHNQSSPPSSRSRGRRRGRGGRKSDQSDVLLMPPSSRPCTGANKPAAGGRNRCVDNGGGKTCLSVASGPFPSSSKSLSFAPRPGYGQLGTKCIVKANHFLAEFPDKDLNQYDVSSKHIL